MTPLPTHLNSPRFLALWQDFLAHRREGKHPMSERAQRLAINKLARYDVDVACQALEDAIIGGWRGVFPREYAARKRERDALDKYLEP